MADQRLHQSIAHTLVSQSPLHAWHQVFGGEPQEVTEAMDIGAVAHELILGGVERMEVVPYDDYRSKAAKECRDAARAASRIPIKSKDLPAIQALVDHVGCFLEGAGLSLTGQSEAEVEWTESGVLCAGRIDHHWVPERARILDLKFVENAQPLALGRKCVDYGYDIQATAYTSAIEHLHPETAGRIEFIFVFAEKNAPYAITAGRPGGTMARLGASRWARAIDLWRTCMEQFGPEHPWPGYSTEIERLSPPEWALKQEMEVSREFAERMAEGIEL